MYIGYAWVSTQYQNPELQHDALLQVGCEKFFMRRLLYHSASDPNSKRLWIGDTLIVWKLDRLARSLRQLFDPVEMLEANEMGFRSLTEAIDTTTSGERLVFHIFGALSEFERAIIRERTKAGLEATRTRGRLGSPPSLSKDDRAVAIPCYRIR